MPPRSPKKPSKLELVQVKVTRGAAALLRKRAKRSLRTQASYLRDVIYRDLGLLPMDPAPRDGSGSESGE
jgi:hypothetical protein